MILSAQLFLGNQAKNNLIWKEMWNLFVIKHKMVLWQQEKKKKREQKERKKEKNTPRTRIV